MSNPRLFAPAAARNRGPILEVLRETLPKSGLVLEIASGTGEHVAHFAAALPDLTFQPSDPGAPERASISGWIEASGAKNILPPLALDAAAERWPVLRADAMICINMIHISPWAATEGLFAHAARLLPEGAPLILYGAYKRGGAHTAPGNVAFDEMLRRQNPEWGVRDLEKVATLAALSGFGAPRIVEMPANNLCVVFRRTRAN